MALTSYYPSFQTERGSEDAAQHGVAGGRSPRLFRSLGCSPPNTKALAELIKMKRYRVVPQEDTWGCGVACVASLLGLSYGQARRRLVRRKGREIDASPRGLPYKVIEFVLDGAGVRTSRRRGQRKWPTGTIVFLSKQRGRYRNCGHYLLKVPRGWMNPWINDPQEPPLGAIRARLPRGAPVQVGFVPEPANAPLKVAGGRGRPSAA